LKYLFFQHKLTMKKMLSEYFRVAYKMSLSTLNATPSLTKKMKFRTKCILEFCSSYMTCQLTCCKEQCRVTICVPMVHGGCRHRHIRPDSTSACNRSTPENKKKNCKYVIDLTRIKVLQHFKMIVISFIKSTI